MCDFKETEPRAVVHEILKRLMAIQQDDFKTLREYVSMLEILASNRNLNLDIQREFEMLEIEIEKLPSFLMGQERGIEQGIEQGAHNKAVLIAKQLLSLNFSLTEIAQITGLTVDELEKLD